MSKIKGKYIENGTIDESKLNTSVNASLDKADSSLQSADLNPYFNQNTDTELIIGSFKISYNSTENSLDFEEIV